MASVPDLAGVTWLHCSGEGDAGPGDFAVLGKKESRGGFKGLRGNIEVSQPSSVLKRFQGPEAEGPWQ